MSVIVFEILGSNLGQLSRLEFRHFDGKKLLTKFEGGCDYVLSGCVKINLKTLKLSSIKSLHQVFNLDYELVLERKIILTFEM